MPPRVVTGSPMVIQMAGQLFLDSVLDDVLQNGRTRPGVDSRDQLNLPEIIFHCMRSNPDRVYMINGASGMRFTNAQILKRAVSLARAIRAVSETETTVIMMLRNHEHMSALYYAMFLAGVVSFMMEPNSTEYEIEHVMSLIQPRVVFCEDDSRDDVTRVVGRSDVTTDVVVADGASLDKFVEGYSDDLDSFKLPDVDPKSTAILLLTSGTTGLPKAAELTHRGLTLQLALPWVYHKQFPKPTKLVLLLATCQWMTHTIFMTSCVAFGVPVLLSSKSVTAEHVVELVEKYQPTWSFMGPGLASAVGNLASAETLASLDTLVLCGSSFSPESLAHLKDKLSDNALLNGYGLTETHGFVALGGRGTPLSSVGKIFNVFDYKLVNEDGEKIIKANQNGELYLRGECILKGYFNNEQAYRDTVTGDGWLKTGDIFYFNEEGLLFFSNRNKLRFEWMDHHVYPEEIESVIGSIPGVQQCVVCGAEAGPTAALVLLPGCDVTREMVHQTVNASLSDYKRLRGGIAFVETLPRTHNDKINRAKSLQLVNEMIRKGECF